MARRAPIRVISFLLWASSVVFCQQPDTRETASSLPDAPTVQAPKHEKMFRAFLDTARPPVATPSLADRDSAALFTPVLFNPGQYEFNQRPNRNFADSSPQTPSLVSTSRSHSSSSSTSLMGRAVDAASSVVVTRDAEGGKHLNKSYLLSVATMAASHVAYRPYWRRSPSQPFGDFGSTIGSDAGINVLHEFEPGLLQLMKSHEPKFVSRIQARSHRN